MAFPSKTSTLRRTRLAAVLAVSTVAGGLAWAGAPAGAADVAALEARVAGARAEAQALAAELEQRHAELVVAQQRAAEAAAREAELSALLEVGQARAAALGERVVSSRQRLQAERRRLARARAALARRLVAIYKGGVPDTASVVLGSDDFEDLVTRSGYLRMVEEGDERLAARIEQIRDAVRLRLEITERLKRRADAYNARLVAARDQISSVRAAAEASAAQLASIAESQQKAIATLEANVAGWVGDIEAARAAAARRAAEAEESAEEQVGRWLGGPWSIPAYIVMCESGGDYGAVNPSSGAGGAYQILPSTWDLYGGGGDPHEASKGEQDSIAAQIWADSGPAAWVCSG